MKTTAWLALAAAASCSAPPAAAPRTDPPPEVAEVRSFADLGSPVVRAAAMTYPAPVAAVQEPPLSLTAADGTGLRLATLDARAVIEGPLAFTELHLAFENPADRVIEGRFAITLPPGAAISRLAMKIDGGWQEAEVVERMAARRAYEDFLHRRQDPALLEKEAGNQFSARIFPIPARGVKEIIVAFSHELVGEQPYRLPLRGLPAIGDLRVEVRRARAGGWDTSALAQRNWVPDRDVEVAAAGRAGLAAGELIAARIAPAVPDGAEPIAGAVVLFDTSASRAPGFAGEVARLERLVAGLAAEHPGLQLTVATFDQDVVPVYSGAADRFGAAELDAIRARRPLGASDLGAALRWAAGVADRERLVIIGDGVATAGARGADLTAAARALAPRYQRLDVVLVGGIRDGDAATALVRGALPRDGAVIDGAASDDEIVHRIGRRTMSGIPVEVAGATWVWPERLDGVQPGDQVIVYAGLAAAARPGAPLRVHLGGPIDQSVEVALAAAPRPLLERAAAGARIARLGVARDRLDPAKTAERDALLAEMVALSTRYRVLCDHTALLVLETEDDYARFGIDRHALADILAIGPAGVDVVHRAAPVVMVAPAPPDDRQAPFKRKVDVDTKPTGATVDQIDDKEADKGRELGGKDGFEDDDGEPDLAKAEEKPAELSIDGRGPAANDPQPGPAAEPPRPAPVARPEPPPPPARTPVTGRITVSRPPPDNDHDGVLDSDDAAGGDDDDDEAEKGPPPLTGRFAAVLARWDAGQSDQALVDALAWRSEEPGDVMALVALGELLERRGNRALAARAYGSLIDLFPSRADLRRFAAQRLERLGGRALELAGDSLAVAVEQRPDHLTGWRQLAYARVRQHRWADAFAALEQGLGHDYPDGRFAGGIRILAEDAGIVAAAWAAAEPARSAEIDRRLAALHLRRATAPSTRFVLSWETDANDVDFHIRDARGGHAYYENMKLASGGELYADVTTGYGPECFTIPGKPSAGPYRLSIHYYSRGPMGYGMGELEILRHDGKGGVEVDSRPFVVMNDQAWVQLGSY